MEIDISTVAHLERHARYHADRIAIVYEDEQISYAQLRDRTAALASSLNRAGVAEGDRVVYLGHNSANLIVTLLASAWIGAVFLPMNFRLAAPEVDAALRDATPKAAVAEPPFGAMDVVAFADISARVVIDNDPAAGDAHDAPADWERLTRFIADAPEPPAPLPRHDDDLAVLLYTSGTTGRPKGVMLSHGNLWWNVLSQRAYYDTRMEDVYLAVAPLFHIGGLNTHSLGAISRGSTVVIRRSFDPARTLQDFVELKINGIFAVAAMFAAIARVPGFAEADLSELRLACAAGAPVPPSVLQTYADKGVLLQQAWGLTETSPCATYLESSQALRKLGSAGAPMPYGDVRVSDVETLEPITAPGVSGELWVRGPNVSLGYWNNPEATAAVFRPDGWFRTGDIGYVDEDGYFYIVDRLKDMIISGGENIYPAEVEHALAAHPDILDAAVVGVPDDEWGEVPLAIVSLREGASLTIEQLREYCTEHLARYKIPRRLMVVDTVIRNASGKLDKPALRRLVAEAA